MNRSDISIVIVSYFTGIVVKKCIESCLKMKSIKEIIVVNNGNDEEILNYFLNLELEGKIKLITGQGNIGFSRSCNLGANAANGDYFLFLNPDCYTRDINYALDLKNVIKGKKGIHFVTSLINNQDGTIQKTCRRNIMSPFNAFCETFSLTYLGFEGLNKNVNEINTLDDVSTLDAFSGASFMCDRNSYFKVGGMSEEYFLYVEDMDLCMKIHQSGGKIFFKKSTYVYHDLSTSKATNVFLEYHKAKGFCLYLNKFFPWTKLPIVRNIINTAIWSRYYIRSYIFPKK